MKKTFKEKQLAEFFDTQSATKRLENYQLAEFVVSESVLLNAALKPAETPKWSDTSLMSTLGKLEGTLE